MAELDTKERLQPALLDRLTDDEPQSEDPESREARLINRGRLRRAALRDLEWLFNATRMELGSGLSGFPFAARSVINYGLPALSGESAASLDVVNLEENIKEAIRRFEPRIHHSSVDVRVLLSESQISQHNVISIEIRGMLWAHPVPLELLLRTDLDLETGEVRVRELVDPRTK